MSKIAQDLADKALAARSVGGVVKAGEYPEWAAGLKEIAEQHYAKVGINKQAAGVMDNIGSYLAANPTLRNSLIGLGGGAGLGALAGLTSGALSDDEDSSTLSKMLNYGLLGGGLGAAGGAAYGLLSKPNELPKVNKAIEEAKTKNIINNAPTTGTPPAQAAASVKLPEVLNEEDFKKSLNPDDRTAYSDMSSSFTKPPEGLALVAQKVKNVYNKAKSEVLPYREVPKPTAIPKSAPGTLPLTIPVQKPNSDGFTPLEPGDPSYVEEFAKPYPMTNTGTNYENNPNTLPYALGAAGALSGMTGGVSVAQGAKPIARASAALKNFFENRGLNNKKFNAEDVSAFWANLRNNLRAGFESTSPKGTPGRPSMVGDIPVVKQKPNWFSEGVTYKPNKSVTDALVQRVVGAKPPGAVSSFLTSLGLPPLPKSDPSIFSPYSARRLAASLVHGMPEAEVRRVNQGMRGLSGEPAVKLKFLAGPDPSNSWFKTVDSAETRLNNLQKFLGFSGGSGGKDISITKDSPIARLYGGNIEAAKANAEKLVKDIYDPVQSVRNLLNIVNNRAGSRLPSPDEIKTVKDNIKTRSERAARPVRGSTGRNVVGGGVGGTTGGAAGAALGAWLSPTKLWEEVSDNFVTKDNGLLKMQESIKNYPALAPLIEKLKSNLEQVPEKDVTRPLLKDYAQQLVKILIDGRKQSPDAK